MRGSLSLVFIMCCFLCFLDIPEDEARYWAKKLEQINAMRDQDVSCQPVSLIYWNILMTQEWVELVYMKKAL